MKNIVQEKNFTQWAQDYVLLTSSSNGYSGVGGGGVYGNIIMLFQGRRGQREGWYLWPGLQNQWGMHAGSRYSFSLLSLLECNLFFSLF